MPGSDCCIRFWSLKTYTQIPSPYHNRVMDPISRAAWFSPGDSTQTTLCYGTGLGMFVFCRKHPQEVNTLLLSLIGC